MTAPGVESVRVVIAAGGTAGHLAPALAVADELTQRGHLVSFAVSSGRNDEQIVGDRGYASASFPIGGLPRKVGVDQFKAIWRAIVAVPRCWRILRDVQPNVLLAGGGYVSVPAAIAAWLRGIPVVVTEADAHLGLANRISAFFAKRLCAAYPVEQYRRKQEVTGRPVSQQFGTVSREQAREHYQVPDDARVVVVVGGSGGATQLNETAVTAWSRDSDVMVGDKPLVVLHVCGRRDYRSFVDRAPKNGWYHLIEYCSDMPTLLAAADVVVSRAGGGIFEIARVGRAAILVPSPNVTADHQTLNAQWFAKHDAAVVVDEVGLTPVHLRTLVSDLAAPSGDDRRNELARRIQQAVPLDGAQQIAAIVEQSGAAHDRRKPDFLPLTGRKFHMMGIGGAGVSALAQLCSAWGAQVSGCDSTDSQYAELVRAQGITVDEGHAASHVGHGSGSGPGEIELVRSSAVADDNIEYQAAVQAGRTCWRRGELLGELTRMRETVVVAGAHGKSTTTAMIVHAAEHAGLDPAMVVGALMPNQPLGNVRTGSGPFIVEGDESDRTLLRLDAKIAVITNIERDHHHTFSSDAEVEDLFIQWVISLGEKATIIAGPGESVDRVVEHAAGSVIRYDIESDSAKSIKPHIALPGVHNVLNAAAAQLVLHELGATAGNFHEAIATFTGINRRFEVHAEHDGRLIVDDYAHHPTEVAAAIQSGSERCSNEGKVHVLFQPHLYSRTKALHDEFARALATADAVWLAPIYGARESLDPEVTTSLISDTLKSIAPEVFRGEINPTATGDLATILQNTSEGDVVMTMGAGDITDAAPMLAKLLTDQTSLPEYFTEFAPLKKSTTIGTGGEARWFAQPETAEQLSQTLHFARERGVPWAVIGLGSNSLISDELFPGVAIRLKGELAAIEVDADSRTATLGGGASLAATVRLLRDAGLSGFEFACAIPGTAGGAAKMNAGAYGGEMKDVMQSVQIASADGVTTATVDELDLTYRHSNISNDQIVTSVTIALQPGEPDEIKQRVKEMQGKRTASQPRAARSFGSVFQNPRNDDGSPAELGAGALIEAAGLKGHQIGGACISPKHGNFIENVDGATTSDIVQLIKLARTTVREQHGVTLNTEVHLLTPLGYQPLFDDVAGTS